jgi:hypothetical protein
VPRCRPVVDDENAAAGNDGRYRTHGALIAARPTSPSALAAQLRWLAASSGRLAKASKTIMRSCSGRWPALYCCPPMPRPMCARRCSTSFDEDPAVMRRRGRKLTMTQEGATAPIPRPRRHSGQRARTHTDGGVESRAEKRSRSRISGSGRAQPTPTCVGSCSLPAWRRSLSRGS